MLVIQPYIQCQSHLLHLPQNDIALPLNGMIFQAGVLQNVGQDVDGLGNIIFENLCIVASLFPRGVGIQVCAQVLDLHFQLLYAPFLHNCWERSVRGPILASGMLPLCVFGLHSH